MTNVLALDVIPGTGFPNDEGRALAARVFMTPRPPGELTVDLRGLPPALLISGFFFGFLQAAHEAGPDRLLEARRVRWVLDYDFQREHVADWVGFFQPN